MKKEFSTIIQDWILPHVKQELTTNKNYMKKPIIEIELRGDRLYAILSQLDHKTELDVTSVWHLCKEAMKFTQESTDKEWQVAKKVSDLKDSQIIKMAQEDLIEEIESISEYTNETDWAKIKTHLTIFKPT